MKNLTTGIVVVLLFLFGQSVSAREDDANANNEGNSSSRLQLIDQGGRGCLGVGLDPDKYRDEYEQYCDPLTLSDEYCPAGHRVVIQPCMEGRSSQTWLFHSSMLFNEGFDGCLTFDSGSIDMKPCEGNGGGVQSWFFDQRKGLRNQKDANQGAQSFTGVLAYGSEVKESILFGYRVIPPDDLDRSTDEDILSSSPSKHWISDRRTAEMRLQLDKSGLCLAVPGCKECDLTSDDESCQRCLIGVRPVMRACNGSVSQLWRFDLVTKRLVNTFAGENFCLVWRDDVLSMEMCHARGRSALWYFAKGKGKPDDEKTLRAWGNEQQAYRFMKRLFLRSESHKARLKPVLNDSEQCSYDPVTGDPIGCDE